VDHERPRCTPCFWLADFSNVWKDAQVLFPRLGNISTQESPMHVANLNLGLRFALCALFTATASPNPIVIKDPFAPPPAGTVALTGRLGEKLDLCIKNRLLDQSIEAVVRPYRQKEETEGKDWRCEYWGKWYTALMLADAYQSTPEIRAKRDEAAKALLATAAPDGYLGTRKPAYRLHGWDVWGCKYALLGVLAYYDRTGDAAALKAARRHADTLLAEIGPGKANIADVGEQKGLAASSVLEPIVLLYQRTGEAKYLDFAKYIVGQWSKPSKSLPNGLRLIEDSMAQVPPAKMGWNKAYEMMSCFEGLCELYRVTGDRTYLEASIGLAGSIEREEVTIIGPGTQGELWFGGHVKQTGVVAGPMETCVTATWMKLLYQLLRLTGEPRYADELEQNLYNGLLGAMLPDGTWWGYFSAPMGERVPSYIQHDSVGLSCCVVNGPRGLLLTPFWAVMTSAEGPVVNLCAPGQMQLTTPKGIPLRLDIAGDYPVAAEAELTVQPQAPEEFTLAVRIPAWSVQTEVCVNGQRVSAKAGTYAKIHRMWQAGDKVTVSFDLRGRMLEAPDGNGQLAIMRGPVVLSLDDRLVPPQPGMSAQLDRSTTPYIALTPNPQAAQKIAAWMAFDAPCAINGQRHTLTFCDFASAGTLWKSSNCFRSWLPQPLDLGQVFETGQTWQKLTHSPYRPR